MEHSLKFSTYLLTLVIWLWRYSENLIPLFNPNPIDYMRRLYSTDKLFYNVRDELFLRGIGFQSEYQSNYFLGRTYEIQHILCKADNTYAYKNDFAMLGTNYFIERLSVNSDLFFNNVPLEGVHHFTQGVSLVLLKDLFKLSWIFRDTFK